MNDEPPQPLHPLLARQLRRLKLSLDLPPDPQTWRVLLERISSAYTEHDDNRYLLERSLDISSSEMRSMYDTLKQQSTTELEARADELLRLNQALQDAHQVAVSASQTKSTFLAHMSHELRTPLNGIIGYTELLIEDIDELTPDEMTRDLQRIQHSGKHLLSMINNLLDLSKIEAGEMSIYREPTGLDIILRDVRDTLAPLLKPQLSYTEHVPVPAPVLMEDRGKLTQILINLLANAIKYTPAGEVGVTVTLHQDTITFAIHDTGEGIEEEDAQKIFESFHQLAHHAKQAIGTGLGLSITQKLVHLLSGDISLESTPGQGSTFLVTLPLHPLP